MKAIFEFANADATIRNLGEYLLIFCYDLVNLSDALNLEQNNIVTALRFRLGWV